MDAMIAIQWLAYAILATAGFIVLLLAGAFVYGAIVWFLTPTPPTK